MFKFFSDFKFFILIAITMLIGFQGQCNELIKVTSNSPAIEIAPFAEVLQNPTEEISFSDLQSEVYNARFHQAKESDFNHSVEWIKFKIENHLHKEEKIRISVAFSDQSSIFILHDKGVIVNHTGDLLPLNERKVQVGQNCFLEVTLPQPGIYTCYVRLLSNSPLSQQFKKFTFRSLRIYSEKTFTETFETARIYQAFFYGAVVIMLCFNFIIFLSIRSSTYFYYLIYLFLLIVFLSSNSGYLLELVFPSQPQFDLYIRFLSAPLLIISYLQFSKDYLKTNLLNPGLSKIVNVLIGLLFLDSLIEILGYWKLGRSFFIILSIASFIIILIVAIKSWRKGYGPARYFLAGNLLLIIGGTFYAFEHLFKVSQHSTSGMVLQSTILIEVALFSLGLADRINVIRKELGEALIDKEIRNKEVEIEKKNIIAEKNLELETSNQQLDTFIYRTAHDIRGPLATLMGLCQVALIDVHDATSRSYLDKLNHSANKMNYILGRLQIASEITNSEVKKETIPLGVFLQNIIHDLRFIENYATTSILLKVPDQMTIFSDPSLLKFIFMNVIENAIKFQKVNAEKHTVQINLIERDSNIIVEVMDNGVGINQEEQQEIYSLFSKAASKYRTPGLGLYMVKVSLDKLNGSINHNSENGLTKFTLLLPGV